GLSGPDIFPTTLENLRRTRRVFGRDFEIIATGGVDSPDKALKLLDEGATAVGYFTGFVTRGPILARLILQGLVAERRDCSAGGVPAPATVGKCPQLIHLSTAIHRRQNRPV